MNDLGRNNLSDKFLVEKVLGGDSKTFDIIIKNTENLVAQIVFKTINNAEDRKDVAQDIYLKVYNNLPHFRFQSKLSTWVAQIAYNTCFNFLEKKKLIFVGDSFDQAKSETQNTEINRSEEFDSEKFIFQGERSDILKNAIDALSPIYKTLITLYHNEAMSYTEIAQITHLPEGTLKNYLFRARKALKENLLLTYKKEDL